MNKFLSGVLLCLAATMSWGAMFPVMGRAMHHIDPFTMIDLRYGIAGIAFCVLLVAREGFGSFDLRGERVLLAWFLGTAGFAGFNFLIFRAQQMVGPGGALVASIMVASSPMISVLLNWRLRGIVPPAAAFAFIALSFAGVVMVVTKGDFRAFLAGGVVGPSLMMLAGAVCWVVYTMGATYFPGWSPYKYTAVTTALSLSSMAVITGGLYATGAVPVPGLANVAAVWPELAYVALVAGFIGLLAWNVGIRLLGPVNGVLFMNVVPLAAFTISALTGVVAAPVQVAGAVVTAAGLVANNMLLRPRRVVNDKAGVGEAC